MIQQRQTAHIESFAFNWICGYSEQGAIFYAHIVHLMIKCFDSVPACTVPSRASVFVYFIYQLRCCESLVHLK
jgi:hypothetical protein